LYGAIALVATCRRSHGARVLALTMVTAAAVTVAVCRMYTGFHYLSDCVAGVATGVVWLSATYLLVLRPGAADGAVRETGYGRDWRTRPAEASCGCRWAAQSRTNSATAGGIVRRSRQTHGMPHTARRSAARECRSCRARRTRATVSPR